jgi:hypothetical protein
MEPELAKALVKFRGRIHVVEKDAKNPHFGNRYASLAAIHKVVDPLLSECGLSVIQIPQKPAEGGGISVRTILLHESGQTIESELVLPVAKSDAQGIGSAISYCRRYALSGILCLTQDDDDGNEASNNGPRQDAVRNAGQQRDPRAKSRQAPAQPAQPTAPAMSAQNRTLLKTAIDARIMAVGTPDDSQGEVLAVVSKALGHASPIQITDSELNLALGEVAKWGAQEETK